MTEKIFTHKQVVRFSDTDAAGIVYFGAFAIFFDEAFIKAMRDEGVTWQAHKKYGFLIPIVEQNIKFFHPLRAGDEAISKVTIIKIGNKSFRTDHIVTIIKDGEEIPVAEGFISRVVVDYDTFKPIQIPEVLKDVLVKYSVDENVWKKYRSNLIENGNCK